jgi:hypothetical protein
MQLAEDVSEIRPHDEPNALFTPLPDPVVGGILAITAVVVIACALSQAVVSFIRR